MGRVLECSRVNGKLLGRLPWSNHGPDRREELGGGVLDFQTQPFHLRTADGGLIAVWWTPRTPESLRGSASGRQLEVVRCGDVHPR